jgi:hypothetical protein
MIVKLMPWKSKRQNIFRGLLLTIAGAALTSTQSHAQTPSDQAARLREVLPADVAQHVLSRIAEARTRQLPAEALENRALKFAAKGVNPMDIQRSVDEQLARMETARNAIARVRSGAPAADEIEAGAEAIRKGVSAAAVSTLAKSAPSGRSLGVPLFVIGSLTDRGLSSDDALQRVLERLRARASDADLESLPADVGSSLPPGQAKRNGQSGRDFGRSHRPASAGRSSGGGPPAGVPGNAGKKSKPPQSHKPPTTKGNSR